MKALIDQLHPLNQEDYAALLAITKVLSFKKGELILREGDTCKGIYYLDAGIIGLYQVYSEQLHYQDFFFAQSFATDIISLTNNRASEAYLIALEKVEVRFIAKESLLQLYQKSNDFKEFGRRLLENLLADKTKLSFIRSSLTAKEKYEHLLAHYPHYIQHIPLQVLASFLGMSRETLSRMRRALRKD